MQLSPFFNPQRFGTFLKRQLIVNNRTWLIEFGTLGGILLITTLLQMVFFTNYQYELFRNTAIVIYVLGGLGLTSATFSELRDSGKALLYMSWPASVFEKLLAHWLIRAIGFTIAFYLVTWLMSVLSGVLSENVVGADWQAFNPFSLSNLKLAGHFIVWNSAFLFGAVYFKSNTFLKTGFTLVGLSLFFSIWTTFVGFGMAELYNIESALTYINMGSDSGRETMESFISAIDTGSTALYIALAPFFWITSYFHLKEREF